MDAEATRTIPRFLDEAVAATPERTWLVDDAGTATYAEAHAAAGRACAVLAAAGVRPGDRVLVLARTAPAYVYAWLGSMYLGAVLVPVNPRASDVELEGIAGQVAPRLVVGDADEEERVARLARGAGAEPAAVELLGEGAADPPDGPGPARPQDPAVLIPTSGTTGRSKLVTQTHLAYVMAGEGFAWWIGAGAADRFLTSLPLFHINAAAYSTLGSVGARASLVLLPRFSASGFLDSARRHGATQFNAIGAMLEILMRQPERPDDAANPLRLCYAGPAPARERQLRIERRFGLRIVSGYAMSETPYGTVWDRGRRQYGTLGRPRQHPVLGRVNEGRVVRDGEPAPRGEVGELQLRNPAVMRGYWGMPEETARVLLPDGWLRTGDLVRENPDGTYTFVGREKEIIRRRGENVAPAEVEEALVQHPAVLEAAVVGVPSDLSEEELKAFVVVADPGGADLAAIRAAAAERLSPFKVPRYLEAVGDLPRTPTGRAAKHELPRDRTAAEVDFDGDRAAAAAGTEEGR